MDLTPVVLCGRWLTLEPILQRDTVYYSILDSEWPAVKRRLAQRLHGPARES